MRSRAPRLLRISFELNPKDWHGYATEGLWAEDLGGGRYGLRNSPLYVFGVSNEDVVFAKPQDEGRPIFSGVSIRSGHSTYRIMRDTGCDDAKFATYWQPIEDLGCSYEGGPGRLLSVDVPASADVLEAYRLLENGLAAGAWDFEEGHCGHTAAQRKRSQDPAV